MPRELVVPNWRKLVYAYRLTHIDNIPHILQVGLVHPSSPKASPKYVQIGDSSIIKVRCEELHKGYRLSDYIPFYFGPRSMMLYVIQNGFNGVKKVAPEDIVYCVLKIDIVIEQGWDCVFTDGHAVTEITQFYTKKDLPNLNNIVKVGDVYAKYWNDENDLDLSRKRQAELLIKDEIPPQYIAGYFVYNEDAKQRLVNFGVAQGQICIVPQYYF